jgi:hypothetical protein
MDLQQLLDVLREVAPAACDREPGRTRYGIYLPAPVDKWLGVQLHWVDRENAITFDTMTRANIVAIQALDLSPQDYTVEAL